MQIELQVIRISYTQTVVIFSASDDSVLLLITLASQCRKENDGDRQTHESK